MSMPQHRCPFLKLVNEGTQEFHLFHLERCVMPDNEIHRRVLRKVDKHKPMIDNLKRICAGMEGYEEEDLEDLEETNFTRNINAEFLRYVP